MSKFIFKTDDESVKFCNEILQQMVDLFMLDEDEALGRMNRCWKGQKIIGEDDLIYHEDAEYWANTIYYGKDSNWWIRTSNLKPLPFP